MGSPYHFNLGPITTNTPCTQEEAMRRKTTVSLLKQEVRRQRKLKAERKARDAHFPYTGD